MCRFTALLLLQIISVLVMITFESTSGQVGTDSGNIESTGRLFKENLMKVLDKQPESDLVFVLDSSGSVGLANYELAVDFVMMVSLMIEVSSTTTLISVVSFSSCNQVYTYVDYIGSPTGKNKCTFLGDVKTVAYVGGGTCTSDAVEVAGNILASSTRPNAGKVIILLTDGESNSGADPVPVGIVLKARGITIFCIALGENIDQQELDNTASMPKENYVFGLRDKSDVANMGTVAKKDVKNQNGAYSILADNSACSGCGSHAACSCATRSGYIECACEPGFYGTGCSVCSRGFYKSSYGNGDCTQCPDNSITMSTQSTSLSSCECLPGYIGNPELSQACQSVTCPVATPLASVIMIPSDCNNVFDTTCEFRCRDNYIQVGGANSTTCLESGSWSGSTPQCEKISCNVLGEPENGRRSCSNSDLSIGTTCDVMCDEGYEIKARRSDNITCELMDETHAEWTGRAGEGVCRRKKCPALSLRSTTIRIHPDICIDTPRFGQICSFLCKDGYGVVGAQINTTCKANGTWSQSPPTNTDYCIDITPPSVDSCPGTVFSLTDPQRAYASINWTQPTFSDNTGIPVAITSSHTPPYKFPIGVTMVTYNATDSVGLMATCIFLVNITDQERPMIVSCPYDIIQVADGLQAPVTWKSVNFTDNSGNVAVSVPSEQPGSTFEAGEHTLTYTGTDPSGNEKDCQFDVIVQIYNCTYYRPPMNGAVACHVQTDGHQFCSAMCNKKHNFTSEPEPIYHCVTDSGGNWIWSPDSDGNQTATMPWPDCTVPVGKDVDTTLSLELFRFKCARHLSEKGTTSIQTNLIDLLRQIDPVFCGTPGYCTISDINIDCGTTGRRRRRRRQVGEGVAVTVTFTASISQLSIDVGENSTSSLTGVVDVAHTLVTSIEERVLTGNLSMTIDGEDFSAVPGSFVVERNYTVRCPDGHVTSNDMCLPCAPGTSLADEHGNCQRCVRGEYQDEYAQVTCKRCPLGTSTVSTGSTSMDDCRAYCGSGSHSQSGLESCIACPRGFFQSMTGSTSCAPCPDGLTTWTFGAQHEDECTDVCPHGTFSGTGYRPCIPCPKGTYQPDRGQTNCISCTEGKYTHNEGAHAIQYCQEIKECELKPCMNEGQCENIARGFICTCQPGFTGQRCEEDIDECFGNGACFNNATCVDSVNDYQCHCSEGFMGDNCESNIDDCIDVDCRFGGTCIDGLASYTCRCMEGFTGDHCEVNLFDCASDPCRNGASCVDKNSDFMCCCAPGFTGPLCEQNKDYCDSSPCFGLATCSSSTHDYRCTCPPGFEGQNCDKDIDECELVSSSPCENGGTCRDMVNEYRCDCIREFTGHRCETELSSDFDLHFGRAVTSDRAELEGVVPDLFEFTLAFWMKTGDTGHYGTPVSYAVRGLNGEPDVDNALTLQDYTNFVFSVNQQNAFTFVAANGDTDWHFVAVTWTSESGDWSLYLDGTQRASGTGLSVGNQIRGRGLLVIGQEQDSYGGSYVPIESFVGTISQVNLWNYAMESTEVQHIQGSCTNSGNAVSWAQLSTAVQGDVELITNGSRLCPITTQECSNARCLDNSLCLENSIGLVCTSPGSCVDFACRNGGSCYVRQGQAVCSCVDGFQGRKCQFDVDECLDDNGGCDQGCSNTRGSFVCTCRGGYILQPDGRTCNDMSYCYHNGKFHSAVDAWNEDCDICQCVDGRASCTRTACPILSCSKAKGVTMLPGACCPVCLPETESCWVNTTGNHETFDGRNFKRRGKCRYLLTRDCGGFGNFEVHFEHGEGEGVIEGVVVYIYVDCTAVKIDARGAVQINGEQVTFPHRHDKPKNVDIMQVEGTSDVEVITDKGLSVTWSPSQVIVNLSTQYTGSACGLCGNMNGIKKDDKLTREIFNAKSNKMLFKGWRIDGNKHCKKKSKSNPKSSSSGQLIKVGHTRVEACGRMNYQDFRRAQSKCELFRNSLFEECLQRGVPWKRYYEWCLDDACSCGINEPCHCESLSAYAHECERNGVKTSGWKELTTCYIECPSTMVYDDCSRSCQPTCSDPQGDRCINAPKACVSACRCPAGRVLHDGRCIKPNKCPAI